MNVFGLKAGMKVRRYDTLFPNVSVREMQLPVKRFRVIIFKRASLKQNNVYTPANMLWHIGRGFFIDSGGEWEIRTPAAGFPTLAI